MYYWTLTPSSTANLYVVRTNGNVHSTNTVTPTIGIKPAFNLKSNVIITGGDGTKNSPFTLALAP